MATRPQMMLMRFFLTISMMVPMALGGALHDESLWRLCSRLLGGRVEHDDGDEDKFPIITDVFAGKAVEISGGVVRCAGCSGRGACGSGVVDRGAVADGRTNIFSNTVAADRSSDWAGERARFFGLYRVVVGGLNLGELCLVVSDLLKADDLSL